MKSMDAGVFISSPSQSQPLGFNLSKENRPGLDARPVTFGFWFRGASNGGLAHDDEMENPCNPASRDPEVWAFSLGLYWVPGSHGL